MELRTMSADSISIPTPGDSAMHPAPLALRGLSSSRTAPSRPGPSLPRTSGLQLIPTSLVATSVVAISQGPCADPAPEPAAPRAVSRGLYLLADTRGSGPQPPPPSALLYWGVWLCSICLLLLATS